jgi:succinate-acetate transporter protein
MAVAMVWGFSSGLFGEAAKAAAVGMKAQFAYACIGYFFFCVFITIAAFEANKVFGVIMVLILVLLATLALQLLDINPVFFGAIAGWSELIISLLGFYAAGALFLNSFFGRQVLPLGKPMGWVKKA